jgi:hypothetical protein
MPEQRRHLLAQVYHTLRRVEPGLFGHHNVHRPGGLDGIAEHLDRLVQIVRETGTPLHEAHVAMMLDQVCEKCPYEFPSRYCPLRHVDGCVLYRHSEAIMRAMARVLSEWGEMIPLARYAGQHDDDDDAAGITDRRP